MKNPFTILAKLFGKSIALILLSALSIFSWVFNIVFFVYRLVAVAFAAIGTSINVVDCYQEGLNTERALIFLILLGVVALRYLMPMFVPVMQQWHNNLNAYISAPLAYKPPVRYTI